MYDQARQDQLRKLWKLYQKQYDLAAARYRKAHSIPAGESLPWDWILSEYRPPSFPRVLGELTCGARTRAGTPCKRKDLYRSGRCKFHGGLSTGPTSEKGKRRSAENGKVAAKRKAVETDPMSG